ncbi:MAG TPA: hypothetical protein VFK13_13770 [Gemmatimonadaceae bacterium]|nr:hypothetical protein [Gemmatimonadaceae bacterium]
MKSLIVLVTAVLVAACGARQVEVENEPAPAAEVSIHLTNTLGQAVNVYVVSGGNEIFLGQVNANSTQEMPVRGVASGSIATLRAVTADGTRHFERQNVTLAGQFDWRVP